MSYWKLCGRKRAEQCVCVLVCALPKPLLMEPVTALAQYSTGTLAIQSAIDIAISVLIGTCWSPTRMVWWPAWPGSDWF